MRQKLLLLLLCAGIWLPQLAAAFTYEGVNYTIIDAEAKTVKTANGTIGYSPSAGTIYVGDLVIPETVSDGTTDYKVVEIGYNSFYNNSQLTSVIIPPTVEKIGSDAFYYCSNLTSITIPSSVTYLGGQFNSSIYNNSIIKLEFPFPWNVHYLGKLSQKAGYSYDFSDYELVLSNPEFSTDEGFNNIKKLLYPASCKNIAAGTGRIAWDTAQGLVEVDGCFYSEDMTTLYYVPCSREGSFEVPATVTTIAPSAFYKCTEITDVTLPPSVTSIGDYAFQYCSSLKYLDFSKAHTAIGNRAISYCDALTEVRNYSNITSIGEYLFFQCPNYIPTILKFNCITDIASEAFYNVTITGFDFPETLTSLPKDFYSKAYLNDSSFPLYISAFYPASVPTSSDNYPLNSRVIKGATTDYSISFSRLDSRKEIWPEVSTTGKKIYYSKEPDYAYPAGSVVTWEAVYNSDMTELLSVANLDGEFTIPASVKKIRPGAFDKCTLWTSLRVEDSNEPLVFPANLFAQTPITSLYMGRSWQYEGDGAMLKGLTNVTLGPSVKSIPNGAFLDCAQLNTISIPASVTSIGVRAFAGCPDITTVNTSSPSAPFITEDTFDPSVYANATLTYPSSATGSYLSNYNNWYRFGNLQTQFNQGLSGETFNVGGFAFKYLTADDIIIVRSDSYTTLTQVVIPSVITIELAPVDDPDDPEGDPIIPTKDLNVVAIADNAFSGFGNITSVEIPATVHTIGTAAFSNCANLASITLGSSLKKLGEAAFRNCSSLAAITIPAATTVIPASAFEGCKSLATVDFGGNVTEIEPLAFANSGITAINLPSVSVIGRNAFIDCPALKEVKIGSTLTSIKASAFEHTGLTAVNLTGSNAVIENNAFRNNAALTTVTLGDGIVKVNDYAFTDNSKLKTLSLGKDLVSVGDSVFAGAAISSLTLVKDGALKEIGANAFPNVRARGTLDLPDNLERIGEGAFFYARMFEKIILPANENLVIGTDAFASAQRMTALEFPVKVNTIGSGAFKDAQKLPQVEIKADTIKAEAFAASLALASASVTGNGTLGKHAFNGCVALTDISLDIPQLDNQALCIKTASTPSVLANVVMSDNVKMLQDSAFTDNIALVDVKFGKGLERVGKYAFANCALDSLIFPSASAPDPKIVVDSYAFSGVNTLMHVSLGNRMSELKENAAITIDYNTKADGGRDMSLTMDLGSSLTTLPQGSIEVKKHTDFGHKMKKLVLPPNITSLTNCVIEVDSLIIPYAATPISVKTTGSVKIYATTVFIDRQYTMNSVRLTNLTFGDTKEAEIVVTNPAIYYSSLISSYRADAIQYVHIGAAVKSITDLSVRNKITFDEGVESIKNISLGRYVSSTYGGPLYYSGESIRFPGSLKSLGTISYEYGTKPSELIFSDGDEPLALGNEAFSTIIDKLKSVYLGRDIVGQDSALPETFEGAAALETVVIGDGATRVADNMFKGCTALKHALMSDNVTEIGENAFNGCTGLDVLSISANVNKIGDNAYAGCDNFSRIVARGTVPAEGNAGFGADVEDNVPLYVPAEALDDYIDSDLFYPFFTIETFGGNVIKEVVTEAEIEEAEVGTTHNLPQLFEITVTIYDEDEYQSTVPYRAAKAPRRAAAQTDYTSTMHWFAPTPEIASVDSNGIVTINKTEPAEIWVYALDGSDKKAVIRVNNPSAIIGDLNGDKVVDSTDLNIIIEHVAYPAGTVIQVKLADINGDGVVDSTDINLLNDKIINVNE